MHSEKTGAVILAGWQKNSLIDYPGKVSCVAFLSGCNFTCPYCHNPELARGAYPRRISENRLLAFLIPRRQLIDGVVISGGEPTLNPRLAQLCRSIHDVGLAVKLDTNGSRPGVLSHLIDQGLVDYIAMDIKTAPDRYAPPLAPAESATAVTRSIRIIMDAGLDYEFRTTCVRPFVDASALTAIAAAIQGARQLTLQTFQPVHLLNPDFFAQVDPGFTPEQMHHLRDLAAPHVHRCLIR